MLAMARRRSATGTTWLVAGPLPLSRSNDLAAVARWVGGWNNLGDAIITPVLDDEEAGAVAQRSLPITTPDSGLCPSRIGEAGNLAVNTAA